MLAALLVLPSLLTGGAEAPADAVRLIGPRVEYRTNEASATRSPWIDANGWRILRDPGRTFVYHVKGETAAQAFTYGAGALISADAPGADAFARMLDFLKSVPGADLAPVADLGVVDDGSDASGELLNLLTRMNLLFKIGRNPDPSLPVNVRLTGEAQNPGVAAHKIRSQIGDENRSLRIYGSEVVIGRLTRRPRLTRLFLLNYDARPVLGMRVRVRGAYSKGDPRVSGVADAHLTDWTQDGAATEFTVPEIRVLAVIDLTRE
jgi:hypothetical protein